MGGKTKQFRRCVSIPSQLHKEMKELDQEFFTNWSKVACRAFRKRIKKAKERAESPKEVAAGDIRADCRQ